MKTCFRLTLFTCLLTTALSATAEFVDVQTSCTAGNAFPISIPFKLPPNDTVFYRWYCNGQRVSDVDSVATHANGKISYTIPANIASGRVEAYFTYRLNDCCSTVWTSSPVYVVNFVPLQASAIAGSAAVCAGATGLTYSVTEVQNVSYSWSVSGAGWAITSGHGTNSITATAGTANGTVSVTLSNSGGSSAPQTRTVTVNALPTVNITSAASATCMGANTTMTASPNGGTWTSGTPATATINAGSGVLTPVAAGTTIITYTHTDGNGCTNTATKTMTVNALPAAVTVAGTTPACGSTTLTASGGSGGTIYWQNTTSNGTNTATASTSQTVTASGTYYFRARSAESCWGTQGSRAVTINPASTLSRTGGAASQTLCSSTPITDIVYTWGSSTGAASISWSPSNGGLSYNTSGTTTGTGTISGTPTSFGAFAYTVTTTASCTTSATGTITRGGISAGGTTTFAAYSCSGGITAGGTTTFGTYTCSGGITAGGTTTFAAHTCSGGITSGGTVTFGAAQ